MSKDTSLAGLDQKREVKAEVGGRTRRRVDFDNKGGHQCRQYRARDIRHCDLKNG